MTPVSVLEAPAAEQESSKEDQVETTAPAQGETRDAQFSALYREVYPRAMETARRVFKREEDAEDAVSEAFLRAWREGTPKDFFFRILRFAIIDRLRCVYRESGRTLRLDMRLPLSATNGNGKMSAERPGERVPSRQLDDQDFLERTIRGEDLRAAYEKVKSDWRHRWIHQKAWWRELDEYFSELERSEMGF